MGDSNSIKQDVEILKEKRDVLGLVNVLLNLNVETSIRQKAAIALGEIRDNRAIDPLIQSIENTKNYKLSATAANAISNFGEPVVEPLIQLIMLGDYSVKIRAIDALGNIGEPAVEPLIQLIMLGDYTVKMGAIDALGNIGEPAVKPIAKVIMGKFEPLLLKALGKIGTPAVETLLQVGKSGNDTVKLVVLEAIAHIDDVRAKEYIIQSLNDKNRKILSKSMELSVKIQDERVRDHFIHLLNNKNKNIRQEAKKVIQKIGAPAIRSLIQALKDSDFHNKNKVVDLLGEIGDNSVIDILIESLKDRSLSWAAAHALDRLGWKPVGTNKVYYLFAKHKWNEISKIGESAVEPLIKMLSLEDASYAKNSIETLGEIGDTRAVEPLIQLWKDRPERDVILALVRALGEISDQRAVDLLIDALKHEDCLIRCCSAVSLMKIGNKRAIEPLIQSLQDKNLDVRLEAANALETLKWKPRGLDKTMYLIAKREWNKITKWTIIPRYRLRAIEPLKDVLNSLPDEKISMMVAYTLDKLGWEPTGLSKVYYQIAKNKWEEIARIGELAIEPLIQAFKYDYDVTNTRIKASLTLRKIGEPAVMPLIKALQNENRYVRIEAAYTLGEIRDPRAEKWLENSLNDEDENIREISKEAIEKIKGVAKEINKEDIDNIRKYFHYLAQQWWQTQGSEQAICDNCNRPVFRGEGYLSGSRLNCERCGNIDFGPDNLEHLRRNPNYFGDGIIEKARNFFTC